MQHDGLNPKLLGLVLGLDLPLPSWCGQNRKCGPGEKDAREVEFE